MEDRSMNEPEQLVHSQNRLGETPIWVPEEHAIYWVDWGGLSTCRFRINSGEFNTYPVSIPVTALARRAHGGWVAVAQNGLYDWDPNVNIYTAFAGTPVPGNVDICYNDAVVDRQGRLLLGTYSAQDVFAPSGSLYCLDPGECLQELDTGYATANGMGVSPDGKTIYVTDMRHRQIIALDYDPQQSIVSRRRVFAVVPENEGMPDGLTVDAEDFVWSGHWDGWRLTRYDPDGKIERQISFPVQHVISMAFGGENMDELYVTTANWGLSDTERRQQPYAGDLFRLYPGVKGLLEPVFAGQLIPGVYGQHYPQSSHHVYRR
jgi:sugar lactone lactonase YvrE